MVFDFSIFFFCLSFYLAGIYFSISVTTLQEFFQLLIFSFSTSPETGICKFAVILYYIGSIDGFIAFASALFLFVFSHWHNCYLFLQFNYCGEAVWKSYHPHGYVFNSFLNQIKKLMINCDYLQEFTHPHWVSSIVLNTKAYEADKLILQPYLIVCVLFFDIFSYLYGAISVYLRYFYA